MVYLEIVGRLGSRDRRKWDSPGKIPKRLSDWVKASRESFSGKVGDRPQQRTDS